ncbi:type II secretion system protein N [Paraburkholderia sp. ZP32-5]|uniref:type II secretion system protein N n=1 Tax=Paraburkholderia sp. ZP32-5 TaxID=2883245 RepID=UPI001F283312|nr:type II secretion system protein N [Paraburkholderia sp. ZP32-5]
MLRSLSTRIAPVPALATVAAAALLAAALWSARSLSAPQPSAAVATAPRAPLDGAAGANLFGASPESAQNNAVQLLGILSFDPRHAAAIVSVGGDAARVIHVGGTFNNDMTLAEIHPKSIVVERHGLRREIALPAAQNPNAYVR